MYSLLGRLTEMKSENSLKKSQGMNQIKLEHSTLCELCVHLIFKKK